MGVFARAEEIGDNRGEIDATVEGEKSKIPSTQPTPI